MNLFNSGSISTIVVGVLFMAVVLAISFVRNLEAKRLRSRLGEENIVLSAYNVHYYGVESIPGVPFNSMGALGLSKDGIYYISRYMKKELFISGNQMSSITATDDFKGKNMYGHIVAINYINDNGEKDRVGLRIPYPEKWSRAITGLFFS
jgi:hypothetical protein